MRLLRSESVAKGRKDQKLRNKVKGKTKRKRLDAICEKAYNRSHREVQNVESRGLNNGGHELELRRSNRTRRAPVLLDSSPMPPKKRQKVDKSVVSSVEKVRKVDGQQCSSSRELDEQNGDWVSRLRSRARSAVFSERERGKSSPKGKRKLFEDVDGIKHDMESEHYDKKEGMAGEKSAGEKSTVVKSKRPGRIKASNVLANENQEIDLQGGVENRKEKQRDEVLEVMDEVDGIHLEIDLDHRSEIQVEDCHVASNLAEGEDAAVQRDSELEECHSNGNVETRKEYSGLENLGCAPVPDQRNATEVDSATADQPKDEGRPDKALEDEACQNSERKFNASAVADSKPRIKLGRRCGLCGGGIDGKPPKILVLEGAGSDNEAYSGSSASEEPNYDVWDGFGDQSGWLGRLLGPINDRFGIAGIWVHQHCAVWSPEVYFAGLGCLKNVRAALYRGRMLKCSRCRRPGATIGCRVDRCPKTYHLPCARAKGCIFDHRKFLIACTDHRYLFQPHGIQNAQRLKRLKAKKLKLELRKMVNDACRKDIEAEEKWLENCGEDEEFLKRESKRLHRDLWRIAPTYIGGANPEHETQFQGWESVAGLQHVIRCMKEVVILPLLYPEFFSNIGLTPPRGVLLHGYPGTGKTLVVRALVGSCARGDRRIAYFARKGADCLGKYVGDAERQLRLLFQVAEKSQPSIIFFDEIDGLAPCRTKQQDQTHNSVVSTLLALMDGLKSRGSVIVIGATNRPDSVDPALRRPGRFDREIYFPLPSIKDREAILSLHTQKWPKPITGSLLKSVAKQTVGFAGADLQALCAQAAIIALRRSFPLQEVLSAAEMRATNSKRPAIPTIAVEEADWLKALSCAPPPCSRRESGIALNDVVSSPLKVHLVPSLLQPLTRLMVCLYMDERIWLPPHLRKASILVKNVIVSALDSRRVQSDKWWLHIDGLLQEMDVQNEIEKILLLANLLVGEGDLCTNDMGENSDEGSSEFIPSNSQQMGARPGLLQNLSYRSCSNSGFQVLICGDPRSGQKHLASCLLHCFLGNVDVWKIDLASISHEGHGDMVHGLTRILMRCASANLCLLYMPTIDLWAVEAYDKGPEDGYELSAMEHQSSEKISCDRHCEIGMESGASPSADVEATQCQTVVKRASYLWTSFVEQVETMHVNTTLIILATSESPFSLLPNRIRQFFGNEILDCSLLSPLDHKVPRFSVQLDGIFDHDKVIKCFAAKLSKELTLHFVQSLHSGNHIHDNSFEVKPYDTVEGDVERLCASKPCHITPLSPVVSNKSLKGKSNLLLAISTVGYQILCYPHFAELCWVTSKLKGGPSANTNGPWKGWPFNSCIVRPINSTEKVAAAPGSSNIKSKESGIVRGLVAVGLSAYRGEYTSLREVCSEIRRVLETLLRRINDKIQAGKDRNQFVRLLSQVAYLEDMVISWAHALQSLEVDTRTSEANANRSSHILKDGTPEGDGRKLDNSIVNVLGSEVLDRSPQEVGVKDAGHSDPTDGDNRPPDAVDEVAVTVDDPSRRAVLDDSLSLKHSLAPNKVNLESSKAEAAADHAASGHSASVNLSNGFAENSFNFQADGHCGSDSGDSHVIEPFSSIEVHNEPKGPSTTDNNVLSKDTTNNSGESDIDVNNPLQPSRLTGDSTATCFYQCCPECFANLHNLLLKIINIEWGHKGSDSNVEDVHDFVASLSANLHLLLSKLSQGVVTPAEGSKHRKYCDCLKMKGTDTPECENPDKLLMMECNCHGTSKNTTSDKNVSQISTGIDSRFVFKDGVLATLDTGNDVSHHCKFEKLCLCFLIEWLVVSKEFSND